jgi:hypothetical protein
MPGINKQPVFTNQIILDYYRGSDAELIDNNNNPIPFTIFTATDTIGSLIERVTVTATGDTITFSNVASKLVYLYVSISGGKNQWALYKTGVFNATTVTSTTPNPTIEWVFNGGLLLPADGLLGIGISDYASQADGLAIVIEGSSYTQI